MSNHEMAEKRVSAITRTPTETHGKGVWRSMLESESWASWFCTSTSTSRGFGFEPEDLRLFALERDLLGRERGRERGRGVACMIADTSGLVERGLSSSGGVG